jgi:hypothetical protein
VTNEADTHVQVALTTVLFTPGKRNKSAHTNEDADIPPLLVSESNAKFKDVPSLENCTDTSTGTGGGTSFDSTEKLFLLMNTT